MLVRSDYSCVPFSGYVEVKLSQPGLQIVEKLATPLACYNSQLLDGWVTLVSHFQSIIGCRERSLNVKNLLLFFFIL